MLKFLIKIIYVISLVFGWSCFKYDKKTNQVINSKVLYIYNRLLMILTIFTPVTNIVIYLKGFHLLSRSLLIFLGLHMCFELFVIARHYKQTGALRNSIVNIFNDALILYEELSKSIQLNFNSKMCKILLVKIIFVDTPINCLRIYSVVKLQQNISEISWSLVFRGVLSTIMNYFFNIFYIYHASRLCVFKAMLEKLQEICERLETFSWKKELLFELCIFKENYSKTMCLSRAFDEILEKFSTLFFGKSFLNLLIQTVSIFISLRLQAINKTSIGFFLYTSVVVAMFEFLQIYTFILCEEMANKMVRKTKIL